MQTANKVLTIQLSRLDLRMKTSVETMAEAVIPKANPTNGYPLKGGWDLRESDFSPVAAGVIFRWEWEKTPLSIEQLVRTAIESGPAMAGTVQTEIKAVWTCCHANLTTFKHLRSTFLAYISSLL